MMTVDVTRWRIATTEGGLAKGAFWVLGIPPLTLAPFKDHSVLAENSDGSQSAHGFQNLELFWESMSPLAYYTLTAKINLARSGTGLIYLTIDPGNDLHPGPTFIDVSGKPGKPEFTQGAPVNRSGAGHIPNVRIFVNDVTILNDPSNYS